MHELAELQSQHKAFQQCHNLFKKYSNAMRVIYSRRVSRDELLAEDKNLKQVVGTLHVHNYYIKKQRTKSTMT